MLLSWGAEQEQATRQAEIASTGKLIFLRLRGEGWRREEKRRGEMRKIINPPNMGTKSDPGTKITIPERKRSSHLSPSLCSEPAIALSSSPLRQAELSLLSGSPI